MSDKKNLKELDTKTREAMQNAKDKSNKVLELTPEQLVYMVRILTRRLAEKEQEIAAAHAAVAIQTDYINRLKEEIELFRIRLGEQEASKETAENLMKDAASLETLIDDELVELRAEQRQKVKDTPLEKITADPRRKEKDDDDDDFSVMDHITE